jgi:hypothetical protein
MYDLLPNRFIILSARKYYGSHATGRVVLSHGHVIFHGKGKEFNDFIRLLIKNRHQNEK